MAFELDPGLFDSDQGKGVTIRIVGVGGCGGNAVNNMIDRKISVKDISKQIIQEITHQAQVARGKGSNLKLLK